MPTIDIEITGAATSNQSTLAGGGASWNEIPEGASVDIPPLASRSQAYYWSAAWQLGEREALNELAAGRGRSFADPDAAIHWLLSDED